MPSAHNHAMSHISRSDALELWYDVTLESVRGDVPDLSARQVAILMTVYLRPAPHTVRSLAAHLNVTKAVITRALNTLGQHGFVTRARDPRDKRSVLIARTGRGSSYLVNFADMVRAQTKQHLSLELKAQSAIEAQIEAEVEAEVEAGAEKVTASSSTSHLAKACGLLGGELALQPEKRLAVELG